MSEAATIRKFRIVQTEGSRQVSREVNYYNLPMIIAVGFKVKSFDESEFEKYRIIQNWLYESDVDRFRALEQEVKTTDLVF